MISIGCSAYLAHVCDVTIETPTIKSIPMVCEFPNVFPVDLPRLPLEHDVNFTIDIDSSTKPISISSDRMALAELKELSTQLQGLLDLGFIWPNVSPLGAPILFMTKKYMTF